MLNGLYGLALIVALFSSSLVAFGPEGIFLSILVVLLLAPLLLASALAGAIVYILLIMFVLVGLLLPACIDSREAGRRAQCNNNLKNIALALLFYEDKYHSFPPPVVADSNGKPMHSWRTLILPYLDRQDLYEEFDFSEPWDGPKNKKLLGVHPRLFACPSDDATYAPNACGTSYLAVVGQGTVWSRLAEGESDAEKHRPASNSILVVEVADADIKWTEPRDIDIEKLNSPGSPTVSSRHMLDNGYFYHPTMGANVAMCDGSVRFLPVGAIRPDKLKELLTVGGCTDENIAASMAAEELRVHWQHCFGLSGWLVSIVLSLHWVVHTRRLMRMTLAERGGERSV
jgi:prepilin-type processing-associated H-X9-DG protein